MRNIVLQVPRLLVALLFGSTLVIFAQPVNYQPYVFRSFAGPPSIQTLDGTNSDARFYLPQCAALDSSLNLYVTEASTVRKITPNGVVTTIAGVPGSNGTNDGPAANALFYQPAGVVVDSSNNVFVVDTTAFTIRKIDTNGMVTTFAGRPFAPAPFFYPVGIAIDSANMMYVADQNNNCIQQVRPDGSYSTLAGGFGGTGGTNDGSGSSARFSLPRGVAYLSNFVYVADTGNNTIRKISVGSATVSTLAGAPGFPGSVDGATNNARFRSPTAIAIDRYTNIFVVDYGNQLIRKVSPTGAVTTVAGIAGTTGAVDGATNNALFNWPSGIAVFTAGIPAITNLFIADNGNCSVRTITLQTGSASVGTFVGPANSMIIGTNDGPSDSARFYVPFGLASANSGNTYVADSGNYTIRKIDADGTVTTLAGTVAVRGTNDGAGSSALFNSPYGVAVDSAENIYVADHGNHTLRKILPDGTVTTLAGKPTSPGSADGTNNGARFFFPTGVAVDLSNYVYVADNFNNTIRKVTPDGTVTTLAGKAGSRGTTDATNSAARFNAPWGVAVDKAFNLYVTDEFNDSIRKITPDGTVSTFAGLSGSYGFADGVSTNARFGDVTGITIGSNGVLYVTDATYRAIRKITPDANVTTIGGGPSGSFGFVNAAANDARFYNPDAIAIDQTGTLVIADSINNTIRRGVPLALSIQRQGATSTIAWPDGSGYLLEQSSPLGVDWTPVTGTLQTNNGTVMISTPVVSRESYFRLRSP